MGSSASSSWGWCARGPRWWVRLFSGVDSGHGHHRRRGRVTTTAKIPGGMRAKAVTRVTSSTVPSPRAHRDRSTTPPPHFWTDDVYTHAVFEPIPVQGMGARGPLHSGAHLYLRLERRRTSLMYNNNIRGVYYIPIINVYYAHSRGI